MKNVPKTVTALVLVALCSVPACARTSAAGSWRGHVVGITDGDTISVMHDGVAEKIRIASIDTPEKAQAFGNRAKQFTSSLVFDKDVTVRPETKDRYGRTVASVQLPDGRDLGQELVRAGMAWLYRKYSSDATLARLESEAKAARRGLWADPNPIPPWEFRRPTRGAESGAEVRGFDKTPWCSDSAYVACTSAISRARRIALELA